MDDEKKENLWTDMINWDKRDYPMTLGAIENDLGIISHHAFTLISVYELDGHPRLLKVRNPWGSTEGNTEYADSAEVW